MRLRILRLMRKIIKHESEIKKFTNSINFIFQKSVKGQTKEGQRGGLRVPSAQELQPGGVEARDGRLLQQAARNSGLKLSKKEIRRTQVHSRSEERNGREFVFV